MEGVMHAMGQRVLLVGDYKDRTLTLKGERPEDGAGHDGNAGPIVARMLDDGILEGELSTNHGRLSGRASVSRNGKMRGMIGHALRTIRPHAGPARGRSLGVGIGLNTAVFSWIQHVLKPIPGVERSAVLSRRAKSRYRNLPRNVVAGIPRFETALAGDRRADRLPHGATNVGEAARAPSERMRCWSLAITPALGLRPAAGRFIRPTKENWRARNRSSSFHTITGKQIRW